MSEMVSNDVKSGMDLLMTKLLPMVIEKLKNAEARITELESKVEALTAKPKRTRKKKEDTEPAVTQQAVELPADCKQIAYLYEMSTGTKLDTVTIGTSSDGSCMTINGELACPDAMRAVRELTTENPAATANDIAAALNLSVLVVCYIIVMQKLCDFTA